MDCELSLPLGGSGCNPLPSCEHSACRWRLATVCTRRMFGLDLGALAAVPVVRWTARELRMPPPPHLGIMAPFATLSHGARSLPVFPAPPISGPGGTPVRRRGTLFPSPAYTG